jgi:hypothetical protein
MTASGICAPLGLESVRMFDKQPGVGLGSDPGADPVDLTGSGASPRRSDYFFVVAAWALAAAAEAGNWGEAGSSWSGFDIRWTSPSTR